MRHIQDEDGHVRRAALILLSEIAERGDACALKAARRALKDDFPMVRVAAEDVIKAVSRKPECCVM